MRIPPVAAVAMLAISCSAVSQTKFCIGGELDTLTPVQVKVCQAKSASLRAEAQQFGVPADWHFVVICDEAGWSDYASFSGNSQAKVTQASVNTDEDLRFTFVRGSRLDGGDKRSLDLVLVSAVSHTHGNRVKQIPNAKPVVPQGTLTMAQALPLSTNRP